MFMMESSEFIKGVPLVKRVLTVTLAVALAVFPAGTAVAAETTLGVIQGAGHPDAIKDSYLVLYRPSAPRGLNLAQRESVTVERTFNSAVRGFAATMSEQQARKLAAHPDVALVEQNRVIRLDTLTSTQQHPAKPTTTESEGPPTGGPGLPIPAVGQGVRIYIIDTGIRLDHTAFVNPPIWGTNTIGGTNTDCNGHGTHVAGIAAGLSDERWSAYRAQLVAVKVLDCNGYSNTAAVVAGVDWVTANRVGPSVANMSLGGPVTPAIDQAVSASIASGITYVIAAGNSNIDACNFSPARVTAAITVGAVHGLGRRAWFSNYGSCLDVFAPGVGVNSAWHTSSTATQVLSGTSMAAPHIAGLAASYLSANLTATPAQVRSGVLAFAQQGVVIDPGPGSPNLLRNAYTKPFPNPPTNVWVSCDSYWSTVNCQVSASPPVTDYAWFMDGYFVGGSSTMAGSCMPNYRVRIQVLVGNSGGVTEQTTFVHCNPYDPL